MDTDFLIKCLRRNTTIVMTGEDICGLAADTIDTLRAEVLELENNQACSDCLEYEDDGTPRTGYGWNENAVDGQIPCACISESGPYQVLSDERDELQKSVTELRERFKGVADLRAEVEAINYDRDTAKGCVAGFRERAEKAEAQNKALRDALKASLTKIGKLAPNDFISKDKELIASETFVILENCDFKLKQQALKETKS